MRTPSLCSQRTSNWGGLPNTRRKAVQILTALTVGIVGLETSAAAAFSQSPQPFQSAVSLSIVAPVQGGDEDRDEMLIWYLLWLYEILGGDPSTLINGSQEIVMSSVADLYGKYGIPSTLTTAERAECRNVIESTWPLVDEPVVPAPAPAHITSFRLTLRSMYAGVGGNPDTLL